MNNRLNRLAVPVGVVGIILLLVVPVPAPLLDVLIVVNILLALVILLTTMFVKKPLDFSVFPSLLLVATLFRLGLNVASTRLVLGDGYAGQVIDAFGHVAVGGSLIIGAVIFLILVVIQFVVVTKGAERVAEVGARFTLDAMPGKQMAIDADLNAGLITDAQARERRAEVSAEADFYGAMDGASKFVKGDAIAGIIIIIINIVGGIAIGMVQRGMEIGDALNTYALLTIGDGLVTQIPALLMAVSTGMIVTRSNAEADMGPTASTQLPQSRNALMIAGGAAIAMALIPGMPPIPFILVGAVLLIAAQRIAASQQLAETARRGRVDRANVPEQDHRGADRADARARPGDPARARPRRPGLRRLRRPARPGAGAAPQDRHGTRHRRAAGAHPRQRRPAAGDLRDPHRRRRGRPRHRPRRPGARPRRRPRTRCPGTAIVEPVFGLAGKWVPAEMRHSAEMTGATVIDRVSVLVTHLSSIVTANAARLLSREDVRVLTEGVKQAEPLRRRGADPGAAHPGRGAARAAGPARRAGADQRPRPHLRGAHPARQGVHGPGGAGRGRPAGARAPPSRPSTWTAQVLRVIMIDPVLEQSMLEGMRPAEHGTQILMEPDRLDAVLRSVRSAVDAAAAANRQAVLVCAPALRPAIHRLVGAQPGSVPVLSYREVTSANVRIETVGVVRHAEPLSA